MNPFRAIMNRLAYGEQNPYSPLRSGTGYVGGQWYGTVTFDTTRVDYDRARALYRNTLPQYKLGAVFARPIINYTAGFMGVPHFDHSGDTGELSQRSGDPIANQALDEWTDRFISILLQGNRNVLRDGDLFVRIDYSADRLNPKDKRLVPRLIHPAWCQPQWNQITGEWEAIEIRYPVYPNTSRDQFAKIEYEILETITPATITIKADEHAPPEVQAQYNGEPQPNEWGFIPVVQFRNEQEENQVYGASDLEPLEPLFRAYHDTMIVGVQGIKLFAKPKVKFTLKDVNRFLTDNFPDWRPGQPVNFANRELFLMIEGEDAQYLTAESGTGGVGTLLEYLFYCIVQSSQVPEFVLGTAVASSKASVDSQLGPFTKTIERKRMMVQDSYRELASMFLAMAQKVPTYKLASLDTYDVEVNWPEITPKDESMTAQTILNLVTAFSQGTTSGLISLEAANEFLRDFIPSLLPWLDASGTESGEQRRVMNSMAWLERMQAGGLPQPEDAEEPELPPGVPPLPPAAPTNGRVVTA